MSDLLIRAGIDESGIDKGLRSLVDKSGRASKTIGRESDRAGRILAASSRLFLGAAGIALVRRVVKGDIERLQKYTGQFRFAAEGVRDLEIAWGNLDRTINRSMYLAIVPWKKELLSGLEAANLLLTSIQGRIYGAPAVGAAVAQELQQRHDDQRTRKYLESSAMEERTLTNSGRADLDAKARRMAAERERIERLLKFRGLYLGKEITESQRDYLLSQSERLYQSELRKIDREQFSGVSGEVVGSVRGKIVGNGPANRDGATLEAQKSQQKALDAIAKAAAATAKNTARGVVIPATYSP